MALAHDLRTELINFLVDYHYDENARKALLQSAGFDSNVLGHVAYSGNAYNYTSHLLDVLYEYGEESAIVDYLKMLRRGPAAGRAENINAFIVRLRLSFIKFIHSSGLLYWVAGVLIAGMFLCGLVNSVVDWVASTIPPTPTASEYFNRGNSRYNAGDYMLAIADYDLAIELDPSHIFAYNNRGNAYVSLGLYPAAIDDYTRALELAPDLPNLHWGLGNVYYEMGDYPNAIAAYREYERITGRLEPIMQTRLAEMGG